MGFLERSKAAPLPLVRVGGPLLCRGLGVVRLPLLVIVVVFLVALAHAEDAVGSEFADGFGKGVEDVFGHVGGHVGGVVADISCAMRSASLGCPERSRARAALAELAGPGALSEPPFSR